MGQLRLGTDPATRAIRTTIQRSAEKAAQRRLRSLKLLHCIQIVAIYRPTHDKKYAAC
jgi:hypothetical protein